MSQLEEWSFVFTLVVKKKKKKKKREGSIDVYTKVKSKTIAHLVNTPGKYANNPDRPFQWTNNNLRNKTHNWLLQIVEVSDLHPCCRLFSNFLDPNQHPTTATEASPSAEYRCCRYLKLQPNRSNAPSNQQ